MVSSAAPRPGRALAAALSDPAFYAGDPHPTFTRLRREAPMAWNEEVGFWAVTRHADVLAISKDAATFCSGQGILLRDIGQQLPEQPGALLYVDPPEHSRYRGLVQPAFAPSRIRALEGPIRARFRALIDAMPMGREVDVVADLAVPFPLLVIADLLGVPEADWPRFQRWTDALIALATVETEENIAIATEMALYFLDVIAERRARPLDDLVSLLATVEIDGDRLDDGELMMFCGQLLVAGNETTRNLVSGGLVALAEQPGAWSDLVRHPDIIPTAVEELLRWTTPVTAFCRTATVDTVVGGHPVAAGEALQLLYAAANRDDDVFGDTAHTLDLRRSPNPQLAFGFGTHFCIGAALARMEGRIVLEELLARVDRFEVTGSVERLASTVISGSTKAPMVMHAHHSS